LQKLKYRESSDYSVVLPTAYRIGEKYLVLDVTFDVLKGNVLVLRNSDISFSIDSSARKSYKFNSFYREDRRLNYNPNSLNYGYYSTIYADLSFDGRSGYVLDEGIVHGQIWLDVDDAASVRMHPFELKIGAEKFEIGPIDFKKEVAVRLVSVNC